MFYEKTLLPSGLSVLSESIPQVKSVAVGFWVGVGSRDEKSALGGISHFLEHLMFKGTEKRSAKAISELFDTLGGELNAFTSKETTCYYFRLLDEHLPLGIEVISDMLQHAALRDKDITSEREVVMEEIHLHEDTPDEQVHDLFIRAIWPRHPLGRATVGHRNTVKNLNQENIRDFFGDYYFPGNIKIVAAGNVQHEKLVALVDKHFSPAKARRKSAKKSKPTSRGGTRVFEKSTEQVHLCYGTETFNARHKDRFISAVIENILGGGMSSRLFQEVREKRGLVYSIFSYQALYAEAGLIGVYAGTRPGNAEKVVKLIRKQIDSLVDRGVTAKELKRAKEHLKGQLLLGLESTARRMMRLGQAEMTQGEILSLDELVERIDQVNREDVSRVANYVFKPERMVLTVLGPVEQKKLAVIV